MRLRKWAGAGWTYVLIIWRAKHAPGWISAIAAVAAIPVACTIAGANVPGADTRKSDQSTAVVKQSVGRPDGAEQSPDIQSGVESKCRDYSRGSSLPCASGEAALVFAGVCDVKDFLLANGIDPTVNSLGLESRVVAAHCLVRPDAVARTGGASAVTLVSLKAETIAPSLRQCARAGGSPTVSCATAHELEWVGEWQAVNGPTGLMDCRRSASEYTKNSLTDPSSDLQFALISGNRGSIPMIRCAVGPRTGSLTTSLWGIGNSAFR